MGDFYVEIEVTEIKGESKKAIWVVTDDGVECWIPKSLISPDSEVFSQGDSGTLILAEWFAEQEGLI